MKNEARTKAWVTRRAKYGTKGHAGSYSREGAGVASLRWRALDWIIELHEKGVLSEGQCSKRLGIERVAWRIMVDNWRMKQ